MRMPSMERETAEKDLSDEVSIMKWTPESMPDVLDNVQV